MGMLHHVLSPAKINLFLKVLKKREDGYHDILTVMQPVSLYDEILLEVGDGRGIFIECDNKSVPSDETNLVYRAAKAFFEATGINRHLFIKIKKNIPVAAGLGGGSSNAATVLRALNEITSQNISTDNLIKIGAGIGSDVPFFIAGKSSIARGRGELLEPVDLPKFWYILVNPGVPLSTQWVYQTLDKTGGLVKTKPVFSVLSKVKDKISYFVKGRNLNLTKSNEDINITISKVSAIYRAGRGGNQQVIKGLVMNDLEAVAIKKYPEIKEIKDTLINSGAICALMSGSGATAFGIFLDEHEAIRAFELLKREQKTRGWAFFLVQGL